MHDFVNTVPDAVQVYCGNLNKDAALFPDRRWSFPLEVDLQNLIKESI